MEQKSRELGEELQKKQEISRIQRETKRKKRERKVKNSYEAADSIEESVQSMGKSPICSIFYVKNHKLSCAPKRKV